MARRTKPELAVGSPIRVGPKDFTRPCMRCEVTVYMHDKQAYDVGIACCVPCFIHLLEKHETDEKILLMLPPGVTPASFAAFLKGQIPSPFIA